MSSSTVARVFGGGRALLGPARSAAAVTKPSKASATRTNACSAKEEPKEKTKPFSSSSPKPSSIPSRPTGIQKVTPVSPALAKFLQSDEASRSGAVKKIWSYIKLHDLQNPINKREIFCDEKLKSIFDGKDKVGFLEIGKLLSGHFVKTA